MNPFLATDGYKTGHQAMYPQGTTLVYSNFTPRHGKHSNIKGGKGVISFGQQMVMKQIQEMFDNDFFKRKEVYNRYDPFLSGRLTDEMKEVILKRIKDEVCQEIKQEYSMYLNTDFDVSHIEALWDLGYLPIEVKSLPEGSFVPYGVPVLTIKNTLPEFFWLTNFLETLISNMLWLPMTSATTSFEYKKILANACKETDKEELGFVEFQGHNFAMRGMGGLDATVYAGLGHSISFMGDDSLPTISAARKYYGAEGFVVGSVNATEHSVMCAGTKGDELGTFRYLMSQFPTGILSIVSDTWDLWKVITEYLPALKDEIMAREGKIVIRPDSGDPVDIICGKSTHAEVIPNDCEDVEGWVSDTIIDVVNDETPHGERGPSKESMMFCHKGEYFIGTVDNLQWNRHDKQYYFLDMWDDANVTKKPVENISEIKGVIELLWDIFGGTVNEQGYKVLDPHIGAIYGDSITLERAKEITERLKAKGFASTNIVLGIGSYTYQHVTRDTHGLAMKATHVVVNGEGRDIFKDPITGDGTKKSARGLLQVGHRVSLGIDQPDGPYGLVDQVSWEQEAIGDLKTIFKDGEFNNEVTFQEIRDRINSQL